jgi:hypothetical protein
MPENRLASSTSLVGEDGEIYSHFFGRSNNLSVLWGKHLRPFLVWQGSCQRRPSPVRKLRPPAQYPGYNDEAVRSGGGRLPHANGGDAAGGWMTRIGMAVTTDRAAGRTRRDRQSDRDGRAACGLRWMMQRTPWRAKGALIRYFRASPIRYAPFAGPSVRGCRGFGSVAAGA